ncbi:flagellar biosynthetic protein FliQ [Vibrio aestuarianus]|uniref:Flagellar biosynthetic protein FliQ n=1 Tax=Vibrio aestuarianus TaxID=28171 RepID=A0A7X6NAE2_9VIBR|nr:flagellar biosynthetic protein FliQ [Vibrio aestuarianus]KOE88525.1 type III secretion protein [Vibrio alginolyticus]MDE1211825.1 flagellar biosynthetic protein FliQ [Vibrio aestuarianus]MDE1221975.1 flagellar biosynthetic protein FliQ [Vibrio aestuarianus]MDE1225791.1 flagellar biosynthetic protein FliQ [Vibrio aestuarianus]MDE1251469.1 flagellar biosynthetic protein FliQ [Vibrio aestuarianus]
MTVIDVTAACLEVVTNSIIIFSLSFVVTGVVIGLLQTVFSVQDPGLPMAAKLVVFIILVTQVGGSIYEQFHLLFREL